MMKATQIPRVQPVKVGLLGWRVSKHLQWVLVAIQDPPTTCVIAASPRQTALNHRFGPIPVLVAMPMVVAAHLRVVLLVQSQQVAKAMLVTAHAATNATAKRPKKHVVSLAVYGPICARAMARVAKVTATKVTAMVKRVMAKKVTARKVTA